MQPAESPIECDSRQQLLVGGIPLPGTITLRGLAASRDFAQDGVILTESAEGLETLP